VVCLRNRSASAVSLPSAYVTGVGESDAVTQLGVGALP
jgi:hypothetical protein